MIVLVGVVLSVFIKSCSSTADVPPYVKQCYEGDPELIKCFISALHHLRPYLAKGIPDIELPSVEPFVMDELSLSLATGPNGYKVSLKDMDIFGASNFTMPRLKLSENGKPFEAVVIIPLLEIHSRYQSSGVLIILPASGNGTFHGKLEGVRAIIKGRASINTKEDVKYLHVDSLDVRILVKNVHLSVSNIYRNNLILNQAINLFLRENGMEVFKVMHSQLSKKLSGLFMGIANQLLSHVPLDTFYVPRVQQTSEV